MQLFELCTEWRMSWESRDEWKELLIDINNHVVELDGYAPLEYEDEFGYTVFRVLFDDEPGDWRIINTYIDGLLRMPLGGG